MNNIIKSIFTPNESEPSSTTAIIWSTYLALWLMFWVGFKPVIFPSPLEVVGAIPELFSGGFMDDLLNSFFLNIEALGLSILLSLPIAYVSKVPALRPFSVVLSTLRFLTPMVFFAILLFELSGGHQIKLGVMVLGMSFALTTSMVGIVADIPLYRYDHARTLRMSEWKAIWYVVVRGTLPHTFDAIQACAATGWSMLMMVEGAIRMEGGVGVVLSNSDRHLRFEIVWLISLILLAIGFGQDALIKWVKSVVCPYKEVA